jgi:hypothetical protein
MPLGEVVPKTFLFDAEKIWAKYHKSPEMICATGLRNCAYANLTLSAPGSSNAMKLAQKALTKYIKAFFV